MNILDKFPTPARLGLNPEKYPEWRESQKHAINFTAEALDKGSDLVGLDMPVGSGKTLVALALARLYASKLNAQGVPNKVLILTATNALMDQYVDDMSGAKFKIARIRGMGNYSCLGLNRRKFSSGILNNFNPTREYATCEAGPCRVGIECEYKAIGCYYYDELNYARSRQIVITNYAYAMTEVLGTFDLVICDEAHLLEAQIDSASRISHKKMPRTQNFEEVRKWAIAELKKLEGREPSLQLLRDLKVYEKIISVSDNSNYLFTTNGDEVSWIPVKLSKEGDVLANIAPKIILMSGTLSRHDITTFRESVTRKFTWTYKSYPSAFPVENRRLLVYPLQVNGTAVNVNYKMSDALKKAWINHIVNLVVSMKPRKRKGIIHSVSYSRAKEIRDALIGRGFEDIIYAPQTSSAIVSTISKFKSASQGGILISPSVTTGIDFKYEQCRWQIICKLPYPDTSSPLVRARSAIDKNYAAAQAVKTLSQALGRGTRAHDDWSETYLTDNAYALYIEGLTPDWVLDSVLRLTDKSFMQWLENKFRL